MKNPATDLAAIRYLFPALIQASRILNVDEPRRLVWQDRLDHLAPYHISEKTGGIAPFEPRSKEKIEAGNCENPELEPVGVFPLITQHTPEGELGIRAFRRCAFVNACGWTTDSICAARLGLADDLLKSLCAHAETHQDHPSGLMDYYDRKPAIHVYLEGSGTFATAMGELLLQSFGDTPASQPIIRVCPALPKAWDAHFKLLAMGGFEVEASAKRGQVMALAILSTRGGRMTLANPFAAETLVLEGERTVLKSGEKLLNVETAAGRSYRVVPANAPNASLDPLPAPPNQCAETAYERKPEMDWQAVRGIHALEAAGRVEPSPATFPAGGDSPRRQSGRETHTHAICAGHRRRFKRCLLEGLPNLEWIPAGWAKRTRARADRGQTRLRRRVSLFGRHLLGIPHGEPSGRI